MFAYNSSMQLAAPQPRRHKVLMSFRYWNAWDVIFFDTDRMRTALPRRARFNSDEALIEFAQRAGGITAEGLNGKVRRRPDSAAGL
jgi:hypothetical protein